MNEDLKKLLDHSVEYATELLTETGESYPFGAYIDLAHNVHPLEMEIDTKKVPQNKIVIDALITYCAEEITEKRMIAYCISYEVNIELEPTKSTDAIGFEMIHQSEKNIPKYYLPFIAIPKDKWENENPDFAKVNLGELFAVKAMALDSDRHAD